MVVTKFQLTLIKSTNLAASNKLQWHAFYYSKLTKQPAIHTLHLRYWMLLFLFCRFAA